MSGPWEQYGQAAGPWTAYADKQDQNPLAQFIGGAVDSAKQIADPLMQALGIPANDAARNIASVVATGKPLYQSPQPKTVTGQYARTLGDFSLAALAPGSLLTKAANVVIPALASETAGQLTKGTPIEAPARILAGLGGGMAVGAGSGVLARMKAPKAAPPPALDALAAARTSAYDQADAAGVQYKPQAVSDMVSGIADELAAAKLNPMRHPKAASMLEDMQAIAQKGEPQTLTSIDQLRQVVGRDVAGASDPAERFMGKKIISSIDRFLDGAGANDVTAGDPQQAAQLISTARDLNTRFRKLEALQKVLGDADLRTASSGSGGNIDNATRQGLRKIYNSVTNWTPDEKAALEQAIRGGGVQNLLRQIGKASPEGNGLMQVLNMGGAAASHGTSMPITVGAMAAKRAADAMTSQKVNVLQSLIAQGGTASEPALADPNWSLPPALRQALSAGYPAGSVPQARSALRR